MDPGVGMAVVKIRTSTSVKEYLELAMSGDFEAFRDEMGKHPLGITAGMDVYEDRSALHLASLHGRLDVVKLLLSSPEISSQVVNARDRFGYTLLHLAVRAHHESVVRLLAQSFYSRILAAFGDDSDRDEEGHDCDGVTPLHVAALSGNITVVKILLKEFTSQELQVNVHATTWQGKTALDVAKHGRHLKLVELLECWDVKWLQLERQKSADSVNAILVGAALVATVTFGSLLQPPLGIPGTVEVATTPGNSSLLGVGAPQPAASEFDSKLQDWSNRAYVEWFLVCTALSFSSSIVSLVIGTTAVIPSSGVSLKREVQELRISVLRASISLFVSIFFLLWASQIGGFQVAGKISVAGVVYNVLSIVLLCLPIIVLAFVLRQILLPKVKVKLEKLGVGVFFVVAVVLNLGIFLGISTVAQRDGRRRALH